MLTKVFARRIAKKEMFKSESNERMYFLESYLTGVGVILGFSGSTMVSVMIDPEDTLVMPALPKPPVAPPMTPPLRARMAMTAAMKVIRARPKRPVSKSPVPASAANVVAKALIARARVAG